MWEVKVKLHQKNNYSSGIDTVHNKSKVNKVLVFSFVCLFVCFYLCQYDWDRIGQYYVCVWTLQHSPSTLVSFVETHCFLFFFKLKVKDSWLTSLV